MTTVTYPLHSCFGQTLPIWCGPHRERGAEVIVLELDGGRRALVPLEWTDERPCPPCPSRRGRPVLFRVEDLLRMLAWCHETTLKKAPRSGKR